MHEFWVIFIHGSGKCLSCDTDHSVVYSPLGSSSGLLHSHILEDVPKSDRYEYALVAINERVMRTNNLA